MDLKELQHQSWQVAESKGQHDNLDKGKPFSRRELALAAMMPFYASVSLLTQYIKRHGLLHNDICKHDLESLFAEISHRFDDLADSIYRDKIDLEGAPENLQTLLRLALIHTEVDEAADASDCCNTDIIGDELADILIRVADLAETVKVDLDAHVHTKMAKNRTRPYAYGTPGEERK